MDHDMNSHCIDLVNGLLGPDGAAKLDASVAEWRASKQADHLVIHFHGGLVGRAKALQTAARLQPIYENGGGWPLFVVWNSDLITTVKANLAEIAGEKVFQRLIRKLAQLIAGKLAEGVGGRGGALELDSMREVPEDPEQLQRYLDQRKHAADLPDDAANLNDLQRQQIEIELQTDRVLADEAAHRQLDADELRASRARAVAGSRHLGGQTHQDVFLCA